MDPRYSTSQDVCGRCGERRPLVIVTAANQKTWLCGRCFPQELNGGGVGGSRAGSLLMALFQPRETSILTPLPLPNTLAHCERCGQTYAEFQAEGRAGCASCYAAFAPAVRHALAVLHGEGKSL